MDGELRASGSRPSRLAARAASSHQNHEPSGARRTTVHAGNRTSCRPAAAHPGFAVTVRRGQQYRHRHARDARASQNSVARIPCGAPSLRATREARHPHPARRDSLADQQVRVMPSGGFHGGSTRRWRQMALSQNTEPARWQEGTDLRHAHHARGIRPFRALSDCRSAWQTDSGRSLTPPAMRDAPLIRIVTVLLVGAVCAVGCSRDKRDVRPLRAHDAAVQGSAAVVGLPVDGAGHLT